MNDNSVNTCGSKHITQDNVGALFPTVNMKNMYFKVICAHPGQYSVLVVRPSQCTSQIKVEHLVVFITSILVNLKKKEINAKLILNAFHHNINFLISKLF